MASQRGALWSAHLMLQHPPLFYYSVEDVTTLVHTILPFRALGLLKRICASVWTSLGFFPSLSDKWGEDAEENSNWATRFVHGGDVPGRCLCESSPHTHIYRYSEKPWYRQRCDLNFCPGDVFSNSLNHCSCFAFLFVWFLLVYFLAHRDIL